MRGGEAEAVRRLLPKSRQDDGRLDQGGRDVRRGWILKVKPTGFADTSDVGYEWKRGVKVDPKMFDLVTGRMDGTAVCWDREGTGRCSRGWQGSAKAVGFLSRASDLGPRVAVRLLCSGRIGREGVWPSGRAVRRTSVDCLQLR